MKHVKLLSWAGLTFLLLFTFSASPVAAQTKTGTTVSFLRANTVTLRSYKTATSEVTAANFGFLGHQFTPLQIVSSTAEHADLNAAGARLFKENDNLMSFSEDGGVVISNGAATRTVCLAVVAPAGYRFTGYDWTVDTPNSTAGIRIRRYTYNATGLLAQAGNIISENYLVGSTAGDFTATFANGTDRLFFRIVMPSSDACKLTLTDLKLTYSIDRNVSAANNAEGNITVHTGLLAAPTTTVSVGGTTYNAFQANADLSDVETLPIYHGSTAMAEPASEDVPLSTGDTLSFVRATSSGDYYVKAPDKYRVTGATLHFLSQAPALKTYQSETTTTTSETSMQLVGVDAAAVTSGNAYIITDGNGNYLNKDGSNVSTGTSANTATQWTAVGLSSVANAFRFQSGGYYLYSQLTLQNVTALTTGMGYIITDGTHYLNLSSNGTLSVGTDPATASVWTAQQQPSGTFGDNAFTLGNEDYGTRYYLYSYVDESTYEAYFDVHTTYNLQDIFTVTSSGFYSWYINYQYPGNQLYVGYDSNDQTFEFVERGFAKLQQRALTFGLNTNQTNEEVWVKDGNGLYNYMFNYSYNNASTATPQGYLGYGNNNWTLLANTGTPKAKLQTTTEQEVTTTVTKTSLTNFVDSAEYLITDGSGHYLNLNGSTVGNSTDPFTATKWTVETVGNVENGYCFSNGDYYLYYLSDGSIGATTLHNGQYLYDEQIWVLDAGTNTGHFYNYDFYTSNNNTKGYLGFSTTGVWHLTATGNSALAQTAYVYGGSYTATVYDGNNQPQNVSVSSQNETNISTVTLDNLNNDGIHFSLPSLSNNQAALVAIDLTLQPLNPELQAVDVEAQAGGSTVAGTTASLATDNFILNGGQMVTFTLPEGSTTCTPVFLNADNEQKTQWYTNGTNANTADGGASNFFLVGAAADNGSATPALNTSATPSPSARTTTSQAGTAFLPYTASFTKAAAGIGAMSLSTTDAPKVYYLYVADQPTNNIMPAAIATQHVDYRCYILRMAAKTVAETPKVTLTPIYTSTLKGPNHKNPSLAGDQALDTGHTFLGVTVTAQTSDGSTPTGVFTSQEIARAIRTAITEKAQSTGDDKVSIYDGDPLRTVLYIDMSALTQVDDIATGFNADFNNSTADNCLYFLYSDYRPVRNSLTNVVVKTADGTAYRARTDITINDQQPFFSPYDFTTGSGRCVNYVREANQKTTPASVRNMAVVLPFDIPLASDGGTLYDSGIKYYQVTNSGEVTAQAGNGGMHDVTYAVTVRPVQTGTALANEPYYVQTTDTGFTYNIYDVQFRKSGDIDASAGTVSPDNLTLASDDEAWTTVGTYAGETPSKDTEGLWYLASDLFWNASQLRQYSEVNIRPFRARFISPSAAAKGYASAVIVVDDGSSVVTGISAPATTADGFSVTSGRGALTVTATRTADVAVVTAAGQLVARATVASGETRAFSLQKGVYLVNGKKLIVK